MKAILIYIIFFIALCHCLVLGQQKKNNKSVIVFYKDKPKSIVDCEVKKLDRAATKEELLGEVNDFRFTFLEQCIQGERYKFHPASSNYVDVIKYCGFKEDTIYLIDRKSWSSLWGNASVIPRFEDVPKIYYAVSAISSHELLMLSDFRRDTLRYYRDQAIRRYYNFDLPNEYSVNERIKSMMSLVDQDTSFGEKHNYADSIVNRKFSKGNLIYLTLANYVFESGGDLKLALEFINKSIERKEKDYKAYFYKANIQKVNGDRSGALTSANIALNKTKDTRDPQFQVLVEALIKSLQ